MKPTVQTFLSYARLDNERVETLHRKLSAEGLNPWMDTKSILPGEKWEPAIQQAIRRSDFFLICLSSISVNRRGMIQKEIKEALNIWREMLDSDIYLIPVRLEECEIPASLLEFQRVDLFGESEEGEWARLMQAIRVGAERRAKTPSSLNEQFERQLSKLSEIAAEPSDALKTKTATLEQDKFRPPVELFALEKRRPATMHAKLRIVVEGICDVVQKFYAAPLKKAKGERTRDLSVTFVDSSGFWRKNGELAKRNRAFIQSLRSWADYIDKSSKEGAKKYAKLNADVVFIATPSFTHISLALEWLSTPERCDQIIIDSPLDSNLDRVRDLLYVLKPNDPKVRLIEHYSVRLLPLVSPSLGILRDLGGRIRNITFYLLENGSGGTHIGPIENELRAHTLSDGLILDMMPHVCCVLSYFGRVETIRVNTLRAGRYTYTDRHGDTRSAVIENETFAHVRFTLFHHDMNKGLIEADVYIGKGVRGVRALGLDGSVKLLELQGAKSQRFLVDFGISGPGASAAYWTRKGLEPEYAFDLPDKPHEIIMERIIRQRLDNPKLRLLFDLPVETAKNVLLSIEEMRHLLKSVKKLPTYHIGRGGNEAPYLEEVLAQLEPIQPFQ